MKHPRCVRHWQQILSFVQRLVQQAKTVDVIWARGRTKGSLTLTLEIRPRDPSRRDLYDEFDQELRRTTPEMQDLGAGDEPAG